MKNLIKDLEKYIEYSFNDQKILRQSLIHKSYNNKDNNEKLEFLGDRVLGLIIAKKLIEIYPLEEEGIIDKKFANLVNKKTCLFIAKKINIKKYMFLGPSYKSSQSSTDKIVADCLEALIGAIYTDGGIKNAEKIVLKFWKKNLEDSTFTLIDPKTKLQEYSLKEYKILPKYTFQKKTGPQHKPTFNTIVQIPNSKKISGQGTSKKAAQQNAANRLLQSLKII
jgi:ribonuclease-3|tara:strand:- start:43 stop:711 length:669 start_codon:yes stop_codon:yes gene_type:complete